MEEGEEEVEAEEEDVGERLAHREGRRLFAGREGLEKFFRTEEEEMEKALLSCGETNELPFRIITLLYLQEVSHTQDTLHFVTCPICSGLDPGGNNRHISNRNTKKIQHASADRSHILLQASA